MAKLPYSYPTLSAQTQLFGVVQEIVKMFQRIARVWNEPDHGTTAERPTFELTTGQFYFDDTLNAPIWWDSDASAWVVGTTGGGSVLPPGGASNDIQYNNAGAFGGLTLDDGELLIGDTGGVPVAATLTEGTSIDITNAAGAVTIAAQGTLIGVQRFTSTGAFTYTPTAGTSSVIIELQGAGGGGAGVASAGAGQVNLGGGGGGGGWGRVRLTANFSGATGSVGAAGAGGAAGNNNGATGGDTTFTDTAGSPTTYTAAGGVGGVCRTSFAAPITAVCAAGGTTTNLTDTRPGSVGVPGNGPNTAVAYSGSGGAAMYGAGADCAFCTGAGTSVAGGNGAGKGGGGAGAISTNAGGAKAGGNGADGCVIVWEFS